MNRIGIADASSGAWVAGVSRRAGTAWIWGLVVLLAGLVLAGVGAWWFLTRDGRGPAGRSPDGVRVSSGAVENEDLRKGVSDALNQELDSIDALKKECLAVANSIAREFPGRADPIFLLGLVHSLLGNSAEAMQYWERGLKQEPRRADVYYNIGWVAMKKEAYAEAVAAWQKAAAINPALPGVQNSLARAFMGLDRVDEAIEALERDIAQSPRSRLSHFLLGQLHLQRKEYTTARAHYEQTIALDRDYTNGYYGLANTMFRLGEKDAGREHMATFRKLKNAELDVLKARDDAYDDVTSTRESIAHAYAQAALIYRKRNDDRRAELLLKRAADLDPALASCQLELGEIHRQRGEIDQAIERYERALASDPEILVACLSLGGLYPRVGRVADAEACLRKAIAIAPQRSWGYRDLAKFYLGRKTRQKEALELARKAVELEPNAANYDVLSWASYVSGDRPGARAALERAMALEPDNARYRERYTAMQKQR